MIAKPIILSVKPFPKKKLLISYCSLWASSSAIWWSYGN